jgi:hypothetical protein
VNLLVTWHVGCSPVGEFVWRQLFLDGRECASLRAFNTRVAVLHVQAHWSDFIGFLHAGTPFEEAEHAVHLDGSLGAVSAVSALLQMPDAPRRAMFSPGQVLALAACTSAVVRSADEVPSELT